MSTLVAGHAVHELRRHRGWMLAMGILLVLLGAVALVDAVAVSIVSIIFFGWVLIFAGIVEGVHALRHRHSGHFFLHVLDAAFSLVVGIMLLRNSLAGLLVMTLLLAVYFVVAGVFRIGAAITVRVPGSGWTLLDGIITLLLGVLVWTQWPMAALWIIGLFIGINLLTTGFAQIMLALALRKAPAEAA